MLLVFEMKNIVEDRSFFYCCCNCYCNCRSGIENTFSFGYADFKVTLILQVEIGTRQLCIWVWIPEELQAKDKNAIILI